MVDKHLEDFANGYIDGITVFSKMWNEHLTHLRRVLQRLREANLIAKPNLGWLSVDTSLEGGRCALRGQSVLQFNPTYKEGS